MHVSVGMSVCLSHCVPVRMVRDSRATIGILKPSIDYFPPKATWTRPVRTTDRSISVYVDPRQFEIADPHLYSPCRPLMPQARN